MPRAVLAVSCCGVSIRTIHIHHMLHDVLWHLAPPPNIAPYIQKPSSDIASSNTPVSLAQEVLQHLAAPSLASVDEAAEEAEDRRLAASANFSAEQKAVLVALRAALYTNLGRTQQRREQLTAELQVFHAVRL